MSESKRSFIAVYFSKTLIDSLVELQSNLRGALGERAAVKWVNGSNIHLTLQFLGQVDGELLPLLSEELAGAFSANAPFEVVLRGAGCFPGPSRPRVIWAGITAGAEELAALYQALVNVTGPLGFEPEKRPFKPHVTLARIKNPRKIGNISRAITKLADQPLGSCQIDQVCLMASELRPQGPLYTTLDSFALGG